MGQRCRDSVALFIVLNHADHLLFFVWPDLVESVASPLDHRYI